MDLFSRIQRRFWSFYGSEVLDKQASGWESKTRYIVSLMMAKHSPPGRKVLDAGCGTGHHSLALASAGFEITGIDFAEGMLERSREKCSLATVDFFKVDLNTRLPFENNTFDACINISVLQLVSSPEFTLKEINRILKPAGTFLILHVPRRLSQQGGFREMFRERLVTTNEKTLLRRIAVIGKLLGDRSGPGRYWTAEELRALLRQSGFYDIELEQEAPLVFTPTKAS